MGEVGASAPRLAARTWTPRRRRSLLAAALFIALPTTFAGRIANAGPKEQAKREFELGKAAFGAGDFDEALQRYRRAYEIVPLPGLLFNIAQCHRNLGNHRQAINFFRLYLAKVPSAPNRAAVETLLVELEKQTSARPQGPDEDPGHPARGPEDTTPPQGGSRGERSDVRTGEPPVLPPTQPPPPPRSRPFYAKWWFWTAVAAAVGGGVAGIYLGTRSGSSLPDSRFPAFDVSVK